MMVTLSLSCAAAPFMSPLSKAATKAPMGAVASSCGDACAAPVKSASTPAPRIKLFMVFPLSLTSAQELAEHRLGALRKHPVHAVAGLLEHHQLANARRQRSLDRLRAAQRRDRI